jgi:hypothetical protein
MTAKMVVHPGSEGVHPEVETCPRASIFLPREKKLPNDPRTAAPSSPTAVHATAFI